LFLTVDQGMFENSVAQQQSPQTSRPGLPSARRSPASANPNLGSGSADSPSSGGQQRLKNVNDLLRRKEPSHLGDIGVTEVNKSVGAVWTPPSGREGNSSFKNKTLILITRKKRLPRALKTTQDMMISSDPVVSSPDAADTSSFLSSPEKTPLIAEEEQQQQQWGEAEGEGSEEIVKAEEKVAAESPADGVVDGGEEDVESTKEGAEEHQTQLQLSVPDLINKDPPQLETRAKPCDVWQKAPGPDSRLASTPRSGKTPCRISLGEEVLLGNGAPCSKVTGVSAEDSEHHPDLLSFE
uniref:Uncharacterized protein n=1 Tax=Labrus bergylta TaxID=56723 RepID=A0A3Q3FKA7_9LABR